MEDAGHAPTGNNTAEIDTGDGKSLSLERPGVHVFVGANGSGKTRLASRIETRLFQEGTPCFRVFAQRSVSVGQLVTKAVGSLERTLDLGVDREQAFDRSAPVQLRHGQPGTARDRDKYKGDPFGSVLVEFTDVLSLLRIKHSDESIHFKRQHMEAERDGTQLPANEPTVFDRVCAIYESVHPGRRVDFGQGDLLAYRQDTAYLGRQLSDGERATLYLSARCLLAEQGSVVIVDEPEGLLNPSISGALFDLIEQERKDCTFVYFTHDLGFASSRHGAAWYWVRSISFGPGGSCSWDVAKLSGVLGVGLPAELALEVLGSPRPVLFVEGKATPSGFDHKIYRAMYPGAHVIPLGNCTEVIRATKATRALRQSLASRGALFEAHGVIDRDARSEKEAAELMESGIHVLSVAEVERLALLPGVVEAVAARVDDEGGRARAHQAGARARSWFAERVDEITYELASARIRRALSSLNTKCEEFIDLLAKSQAPRACLMRASTST